MKPYYERDGITLYCGDCREVIPTLGSVGVVLTDPPYGVGLGTRQRAIASHGNDGYTAFADTGEFVRSVVIGSALPLCRQVAKRVVLSPGMRMFWEYPRPDHVMCMYQPAGTGVNVWGFTCWQPILCYGSRPKKAGSLPDAFTVTSAAEPNGHPCPKPLKPWVWLLDRVSTQDEVVLDPFTGSGTTLCCS